MRSSSLNASDMVCVASRKDVGCCKDQRRLGRLERVCAHRRGPADAHLVTLSRAQALEQIPRLAAVRVQLGREAHRQELVERRGGRREGLEAEVVQVGARAGHGGRVGREEDGLFYVGGGAAGPLGQQQREDQAEHGDRSNECGGGEMRPWKRRILNPPMANGAPHVD